MNDTEMRRRQASERLNRLNITTDDHDKPYVFISYKSDNWQDVLEDVVYELQKKYGLRVYYDRDFETNNELWISSMQKNLKSQYCIAVLAFYSEEYVTSYATLLEILTSQRKDCAVNGHAKEIVPIFLRQPDSIEKYGTKAKFRCKNRNSGIKKTEWEALADCLDNFNLKTNKITPQEVKDACEEISNIGKCEDLNVSQVIDCFIAMEDEIAKNHNKRFIQESFLDSLYKTIRSIDKKVIEGMRIELDMDFESVFDSGLINEKDLLIPMSTERDDSGKDVSAGLPNAELKMAEEPVTEKTIEECEQELVPEDTIHMNDVLEEPKAKENKKYSLTGNVKYTLYGREYVENQSDMMLRIFAQVLNRHQDKVDLLPQQDGMNCAAKYEDIDNPNTKDAKPSYFRICQKFDFANGTSVCIGTAYSSSDKMKKIARLLEICGEERSIFHSEQLELPAVRKTRVSSGGIAYSLYGQSFSGDQTEMMCNICKTLVERYPEKLEELVEGTLCIGWNDRSTENVSYFRVSRQYVCNGREYRIGTSFGLPNKVKEIEKVLKICGEDSSNIHIEGYELQNSIPKAAKRTKKEKNFFA